MGTMFPQNYQVINVATPQVGVPGAVTSDIVCLKNALKAWIVVQLNPVGGAALALIPQRCTNVAAGEAGVLVTAVPIYSNADTVTSDVMTRQADAVNFTTAADVNPKMVIFQIDPAALGLSGTGVPYDCIRLVTGALPATDFVSITIIVEPRYAECPAPSYLTD